LRRRRAVGPLTEESDCYRFGEHCGPNGAVKNKATRGSNGTGDAISDLFQHRTIDPHTIDSLDQIADLDGALTVGWASLHEGQDSDTTSGLDAVHQDETQTPLPVPQRVLLDLADNGRDDRGM
jgi:hypothetical protein